MTVAFFSKGEGADGSDDLANKLNYYIDFYHVPTGESVQFKAFLTNFDDSYKTEWNSEEVYGRMDPIQSYKGTRRSITLEWDVVAGSVSDAKDNLAKCSALFGMLYPVLSGTVVRSPPLMRVRFVNLIVDASSGGASGGSAASTGLACTINGFNYSPEIDSGFMHRQEMDGMWVYPQLVKLSCELTVLHTHKLGYNHEGKRHEGKFPYGSDLKSLYPRVEPDAAGNAASDNEQQEEAVSVEMAQDLAKGKYDQTDIWNGEPDWKKTQE